MNKLTTRYMHDIHDDGDHDKF